MVTPDFASIVMTSRNRHSTFNGGEDAIQNALAAKGLFGIQMVLCVTKETSCMPIQKYKSNFSRLSFHDFTDVQ